MKKITQIIAVPFILVATLLSVVARILYADDMKFVEDLQEFNMSIGNFVRLEEEKDE